MVILLKGKHQVQKNLQQLTDRRLVQTTNTWQKRPNECEFPEHKMTHFASFCPMHVLVFDYCILRYGDTIRVNMGKLNHMFRKIMGFITCQYWM